MTAVRYDDVVPASVAPAPTHTSKPGPQARAGSGDPLTDLTTRLLSIPLRQLYAALWRAGLIEVRG